ncbi:MAG: CBS domain-containing protein [Chloroflexi bacterium]|nr:CBS domain-containing protein [Chloroflexota bacterium]
MFVEQVMTAPAVTVGPEASVGRAWSLLQEGHFRHLPVVRLGRLAGMVSDRDLRVARALAEEPNVGKIMHADVVSVTPDTPIEEASRLLLEHKIGALPVLKDGHLVGIVTESDLFRMLTRVMGVLEPSTRLQLVLDDPSRQLADVTRIAHEHRVRIVSLVTVPGPDDTRQTVVLRAQTIAPEPLIRDLERTGVHVVGPVPGSATGPLG